MIVRAAPFAVCLLWLAYESHFSPSFFLSTVEHGFAALAGGVQDAAVADRSGSARDKPDMLKTASATEGAY
jgi:hypothetical protein